MTVGDLRQEIWTTLMRERVAAYPYPPFGHHPNFKGATGAANQLLEYLLTIGLQAGQTVLSYPDYVLKPLRKGLLEAGVNVLVPAKYGSGFRWLEAGKVNSSRSSSIAGAEKQGLMLGPEIADLPALSMTFIACVAIDYNGRVLSKGYGFKIPVPLEVLPAATIVHPLQLRERLIEADSRVSLYALANGTEVQRQK